MAPCPTRLQVDIYRDPAFTANGRYLYAQQGPRAAWWDTATGERLLEHSTSAARRTATSSLRLTALRSGSMRWPGEMVRLVPVLLATATGKTVPLAGDMPPYQAITQLGFSPDGAYFFVNGATFTNEAGSDRVVRVWEMAHGPIGFAQRRRCQRRGPLPGGWPVWPRHPLCLFAG